MRCSARVTLHALLVSTLLATVVSAQTVDEIVAKNLAAKGGADKLKGIQTMRLTGTISARDMTAPFTISSKRPNLARQETQMQGVSMVRGFDGTTPWMMMSGQVREITGPEAQATREQADFDSPLVDYRAKGNTVELVGPETVDGVKVYHLKVTTKAGASAALLSRCRIGIGAPDIRSRSIRTARPSTSSACSRTIATWRG